MPTQAATIPDWISAESSPDAYAGRRVVVVGLGLLGGGLGAVQFFAQRGAEVVVVDRRDANELAESVRQIEARPGIALALRCDDPEAMLRRCRPDLVCVTPGIRPDAGWVRRARTLAPLVTTEIGVFLALCPARVVAVTGSNGKSTTSALAAWMIARAFDGVPVLAEHMPAAGPRLVRDGVEWLATAPAEDRCAWWGSVRRSNVRQCFLGGNIGGSLLPCLPRMSPDDVVVLELSSFQLAWLRRLRPRFHVAVVTGFSPNHLDWHRSLDEYRRCKQLVLAFQTPADWAVLSRQPARRGSGGRNTDDPAAWPVRGGRITVSVPEDPEAAGTDCSREGRGAAKLAVCVSPPAQRGGRDAPGVMGVQAGAVREAVSRAWGELRLPGVHNGRNAAVAAATACLFGAGSADVAAAAASFPGLPQRLQTVGHVAGVPVIDDSASTTIESTLAALRALGEGCVLICGGTSKGADPRPLVAAFTRCRAVATIGPAGTELVRLWNGIRRNAGVSPSPAVSDVKPQVADCGTLDRAVRWALKQAPGSRALLFSPAFSSFHAYRNYAERGAHFLECVRRYIGGDGASGRHAGSA